MNLGDVVNMDMFNCKTLKPPLRQINTNDCNGDPEFEKVDISCDGSQKVNTDLELLNMGSNAVLSYLVPAFGLVSTLGVFETKCKRKTFDGNKKDCCLRNFSSGLLEKKLIPSSTSKTCDPKFVPANGNISSECNDVYKEFCQTHEQFTNEPICIKWLKSENKDAKTQYLKTLSDFCVGDNLEKTECVDNCKLSLGSCEKGIIDYCQQKITYYPLEPVLEDPLCDSLCATTTNDSAKTLCDVIVKKSCDQIYPQTGATNSNCNCFFENTTKIGKQNLDSEDIDEDVRSLPVVCTLSSCRGSGYKTIAQKDAAGKCPPCVQINGVRKNIGDVSNVIQSNQCSVIQTGAGSMTGSFSSSMTGSTGSMTGSITGTIPGSSDTGSNGSSMSGTSSIPPEEVKIVKNYKAIIATGIIIFLLTICSISFIEIYEKPSYYYGILIFLFGSVITGCVYLNSINILFSSREQTDTKNDKTAEQLLREIEEINRLEQQSKETIKDCPVGYYCPGGDKNSATECSTGSYCPGNLYEINCPVGYYCPVPSQKNICPPGYYCGSQKLTKFGDEYKCPKGNYCSRGGNWPPVKSQKGSYCPDPGMISEMSCPIGYYCPDSGMSSPKICPSGYYCNTGGISDLISIYKCPIGYYCPTGGNSNPVICPNTTYCGDPGYYDPPKCQPGYYCKDGGNIQPVKCPTGSYCPTGSSAPILCDPGYYQPKIGQSSCIRCPAGQYCGDTTVNGGKGTVNPSSPDGVYTSDASWTDSTQWNNAFVRNNGATKQDVEFCPGGAGWPSLYTANGTTGRSYLSGNPTNPTCCTNWYPSTCAAKDLR